MKISPVTNNYKAQSENRQSFGHIRYLKDCASYPSKILARKVLQSDHVKFFRNSVDFHLSMEEPTLITERLLCKVWQGDFKPEPDFIYKKRNIRVDPDSEGFLIDLMLEEGIDYAKKHPRIYKPKESGFVYKLVRKFSSWLD